MSVQEELEGKVSVQGSELANKLGNSLGLDPNVTILLKGLISRGLPTFATWAESNAAKAVYAGAKKLGLESHAPAAAKWANSGVGYAVASLPQIFDVFSTIKAIGNKLGEDNSRYQSILAIKKKSNLGFFTIFSYGASDNSVLSELGSEYRDMFWDEAKRVGVGSISAIPQFYLKSQRDKTNTFLAPFKEQIDQKWEEYLNSNWHANKDDNAKHDFALQLVSDLANDNNVQAQESMRRIKATIKPDINSIVNDYGTILGEIGVGYANKALGGKNKRSSGTRTIDLIADLTEQVKNNPDSEDFEVGGKIRSLANCVEYIFQYHQKRLGHKLLPEHRLSEITSQIADAIKDTECPLKPEALAYLVGDTQGQRIILDAKKGTLANDEQVEKAIDSLSLMCNKTKDESYDPKAYESETGINRQFMKAFLEGIKDNPAELAKFSPFFRSGVLIRELGLTKREVKALYRQGHKAMVDVVSDTIIELANMSQGELKEFGYTDPDIKFIRTVAVKVQDRGEEEVNALLRSDEASKLKNVVARRQITSWAEKVELERGSRQMDDESQFDSENTHAENAPRHSHHKSSKKKSLTASRE